MEIQQKTYTDNKLLRINIDRNWTSSDFSNLFQSLTLLYQLAIEIDSIDFVDLTLYNKKAESELSQNILNLNGDLYKKLKFPSTYENAESIDGDELVQGLFFAKQRTKKSDLIIGEIKFASPGHTDFIGLGKIVEQIFSLIKYYVPNKQQKLVNKKLQMDLITKQINYMQKLGYDKKEIRKYYDVRDNAILNLRSLDYEQKISSFELKKIE